MLEKCREVASAKSEFLKVLNPQKASGLRFYKDGCKIKGNQGAWPGFISQQIDWALAMRQVIDELGL